MRSLHSVLYVSTAVSPFSTEELAGLLARSRERNQKTGITGLLLHKRGYFMQAFEGEKNVVRQLSEQIARDPRHHNLIVLLDGPIPQREFPDWSMGYHSLDESDGTDHPHRRELLETLLNYDKFSLEASLAKRLLLGFTGHQVGRRTSAQVA